MSGLETRRNAASDSHDPLDRQLVLPAEDGAKLLAFDEGHGDELDAVELAEFVDADHVLVSDLTRQQELLLEAALEHCRRRRVRGHLWPDHLERDDDAELGVPRLIHSTHAADSEQADDVIARAEWLAGRKRTRGRWLVGGTIGARAVGERGGGVEVQRWPRYGFGRK